MAELGIRQQVGLLVVGSLLTLGGTILAAHLEGNRREKELAETHFLEERKRKLEIADRKWQSAKDAFNVLSGVTEEELFWLAEHMRVLYRFLDTKVQDLPALVAETKQKRDQFTERRIQWSRAIVQRSAIAEWNFGNGKLFRDGMGEPVQLIEQNLLLIERALVTGDANPVKISEFPFHPGGSREEPGATPPSPRDTLDHVWGQLGEEKKHLDGIYGEMVSAITKLQKEWEVVTANAAESR